MGTGSFPGLKRPVRCVDHPPLSSADVKETVQLYIYSPCGPSWLVLVRTLPLPFISFKTDLKLGYVFVYLCICVFVYLCICVFMYLCIYVFVYLISIGSEFGTKTDSSKIVLNLFDSLFRN